MLHTRKLKNGKTGTSHFNRLTLLAVIFFVLAGLLVIRLFVLQVVDYDFYDALASGQHDIYEELLPERGEIFVQDRNNGAPELYPIAVNRKLSLLYAVPNQVTDAQGVAREIAGILGSAEAPVAEAPLIDKLTKRDDPYEPLAHFVSDIQRASIEAAELPGIFFSPEFNRYYPEAAYFSQLTGFLGFQDDQRIGQYGIEGFFNDELAGKQGSLLTEKDASGNIITVGSRTMQRAVDGTDVVLSIYRTLQFKSCDLIKQAVIDTAASSGTIIVMEPTSGAIRVLCNYPTFDANNYAAVDSIGIFTNSAVSANYEPGSIMKPITMAAAIDSGTVTPATTFIDVGKVELDDETIRNADNEVYGKQNMTQVLENSINTGAIFAALETGKKKFRSYLENFGLGALTDVDLPGEVAGDISALYKAGDIYTATAAFGQGISVTPLQIVSAFATLVNGGKVMKPYIVENKILGVTEEATEPVVVREAISSKTSSTMSAMLISVVKNGHGQAAAVPGYHIGGKTGTAQVPKTSGLGYSNDTIHSFVGFGPIEEPKFVALVKIDKPQVGRFSSSTAAPVFSKLASYILNYYQVPPNN
jgi:cell division protein FtsI/penicillin-binding protein 2